MSFVKVVDALKCEDGKEVSLRGWVHRIRVFKDKVFIVLRDSSGVMQCVVKERDAPEAFEKAQKLTLESSIIVHGTVKRDPRAPGGAEVHVKKLEVVGLAASPYPISETAVEADSEILLDYRHLWIRSRKMNAILKVRHTVFKAIHEYFRSHGFYEVQAPMFITAAVEGGATLFEVKYFDRIVYLTQSAQFYLEALIYSLEKVYTVAPSFRAEKSRTRRHLTEFWHAEAEEAWIGLEENIRRIEDLVSYIVKKVLEERLEELEFLGRNIEKLELAAKKPYPRLTYDEVVERLKQKGFDIKWGDDLGADEERALTMEFDQPLFVTHYPRTAKAFYHKDDPQRPEVTLSVDLLAPEGYGEIVGGGERIEDEEKLVKKIKEFGLRPEDYQWYIDLRRYGSVPHAGFGLGVDRTVMWICGLQHIREAVPFPRDIRRVYP